MKLSRREFFISSGLFALTAGRIRASEKQSIIVLGGGLSGLSTAIQLAEKGHNVTVIEARDRLGGRVFTLRKPFSDDLFTETGGELIGDGYRRILGYADRFGIEYSELRAEAETGGSVAEIQDGIGRNAYMKGQFFRKGDRILKHPYGLSGDEGKMLPQTILGKQLRLIGNEIRNGKTSLAELDKISLARALRDRGVSKQAIKLIDISLNYNSIKSVSAGAVIDDGLRRRNAGTVPLQIKGGNDLLIKAMGQAAKTSGVEIRLETPVTAIEQNDRNILVRCNGPEGSEIQFRADHVVCTIPFSVLKGIPITPLPESSKQAAIKGLDYTKATKVFLQAKYAEWDKRSLGSSIWTDTPIERIFSTTGRSGHMRALFTIWADGRGSEKLEKLSSGARKQYAITQFEKVLPFMKGSIERSHDLSWTRDPYAKGAYAHFKVGQLESVRPFIAKPVGRIHFAGEHTATVMPGMEGALESADRVVKEILT